MPGRNKIMPPEEGKVLSATLALPVGQRRPIKPRPPPAKALLSLKVALRPSLSVCSPKSKTRVEIVFFNYLSIKSSDEPTIKGDGLARRVSSTHSNAPVTRLQRETPQNMINILTQTVHRPERRSKAIA